jgi:regulator of extracellular matrix RemA (YlzA/DUF370 family)
MVCPRVFVHVLSGKTEGSRAADHLKKVRNGRTMMIWIGNKNFVESSYVDEILLPHASGAATIKLEAAETGMLIIASGGKKIRSIIKLRSKHIVLSAIEPRRLEWRLKKECLVRHPQTIKEPLPAQL